MKSLQAISTVISAHTLQEESSEIERGIKEGVIESSESSSRCPRPLFYRTPSILRRTTDGALDMAESGRVKGFPLDVTELIARLEFTFYGQAIRPWY